MPFEQTPPRRKIAVIGGGISGMGAAHRLADHHDVTLIEAEPRLGGHARTVMAGRNGDRPVDTGFIVYNQANYPNLTRLFAELEVPVVKSNMSFAASVGGGRLEYGLAGPGALFAQRRNIGNRRFLGMIRDILRFNKRATGLARRGEMTVREFLEQLGTGAWFRDYYLLPLSGAIWSTPKEGILDFPAKAMVQFFENHALLGVTGQHQWYTVAGGSVQYVQRLQGRLRVQGVSLRLGAPVRAVRRGPEGVHLRLQGGGWEQFDEVVFATHSDDTLRILGDDARPAERAALGAIRYQPNDIVLHADPSVMPRRQACWSSWNYTEDADPRSDRIDLTYWMNSLQPIPKDDPHFVTLNTRRPIREELIYDQVTLRHPVYDTAALAAQDRVRAMNGANGTWFAGAWLRNGFHEDGLASGLDAAEAILARDTAAQMAAQ